MMDWILALIPGGGLTAAVAGLMAVVGGFVAVYVKGRWDGNSKAETRVLRGRVESQEEQLEMHREADAFEREVKALKDAEAKKEALEWSDR